MYKILIVDDEEVEREGIKLLINKYKIELDIAEAENGEKALEYINNNHVDILFTDIKMPFMDGLELTFKARQINPKLKVIIFSAYGQFEYAKKAIDHKAISYILKPIEIEEFISVIENVIKICSEEEIEEKKTNEIMEGYKKVLVYEKEKLLLDLINGEADEDFLKRLDMIKFDLKDKYITMLIIDMRKRFFDLKNFEFENFLKNFTNYNYEYLNLNEYQSIIFLCTTEAEHDKNELIMLCEMISKAISETYNLKPCLLFGNTVNKLEDIAKEYKVMEQELDSKFFNENGDLLFTSNTGYHISSPTTSRKPENLNNTDNNKTVIKKVFDIIEKEYMRDISLEYISEKVYLTPSYLSYLFKKETDQSLVKYITLFRLKKARELLDNSNMRIVDIGENVGYTNLSYFCMIFRNNYGVTPAKYRERVEKN